jgi:hypothetical protein
MIASLLRTLGMNELQGGLTNLRLRTTWFVASAVVGSAGVAFLALAAYQGLARVMPTELAAVVLGLALLVLAAVLYRCALPGPQGSELPRPAAPEPTAELGQAVASLLRQTELGSSDLATASLVAGLVFGSRGFGSR